VVEILANQRTQWWDEISALNSDQRTTAEEDPPEKDQLTRYRLSNL
jgi:hypothetical protein